MQEGGSEGRGDLWECLVALAPDFGAPSVVEGVDGAVAGLEVVVPALDRGGVEILADVALELVVDLPGDQGGVATELAGHGFDDAGGGGAHGGVVCADVLACAVDERGAGVVDEEAVGVAVRQPDRRGGGGRAEDDRDVGGVELIHDAAEEREVDAALVGFHAGPGELADADNVDAEFLHPGEVAGDFAFGPEFGVVGGTVVEPGGGRAGAAKVAQARTRASAVVRVARRRGMAKGPWVGRRGGRA